MPKMLFSIPVLMDVFYTASADTRMKQWLLGGSFWTTDSTHVYKPHHNSRH